MNPADNSLFSARAPRSFSDLALLVLAAACLISACGRTAETQPVTGSPAPTTAPANAVSENSSVIDGRVVGVSDGDTVTILTAGKRQIRIRVSAIDAPEKGQPFGDVAKRYMSSLVFGRDVSVDVVKLDRYGRTVGRLRAGGNDAGLEMIKAGLAWHYKQYERDQPPADRATYSAAENEARGRHAGLWAQPKPQPPWEFRHGGI